MKEVSEVPVTPRKKYGWLPVLTVLFLISYGLMTMLIVEQDVVSGLSISDRGYVVQNGAVLLADTAKNLLTNEMVRAAYLGL